jgi:hypothetical protein
MPIVVDSITASSGTWGVGRIWAPSRDGVRIGRVTLTYVMTTSPAITPLTIILNTAVINDGMGHLVTRTAGVVLNGYGVYLPVVRK